MNNLNNAVEKTINFVFADIEEASSESKKRLNALKSHIGKVANIPIEEIQTNENIRKSIDTKCDSFLRLVESIKKYGVLENIVVELRINNKGNAYKLVCIAGHRRILAALVAQNINRIPCLIQSFKQNGDHIGVALAENLNREDLHCLDVADGYQSLIQAGWSEEDLANHFCRDTRTIRHYLKMSTWSDEAKNMFREHPEVFSTRVIMRQFAYKKFVSDHELKAGIKAFLLPKAKKDNHKKNHSSAIYDKKILKSELKSYLAKQKLLSELIKNEITKAFVELKLI